METAVYLLLCLPKRLGGYGLPKPILNPKIIISNPDGPYRDSRREIELTVANIKVLPLTRQQLMSADGFDAFAQGLRRLLGIRSRSFDAQWMYRRDELRQTLLASWE